MRRSWKCPWYRKGNVTYENWFWELIVIVIVAFVFIGPDQLPVYAKKIGKMLRELKKYTGAASEEIQKNVVEPLNEIQAP